jgi:hypothetical protein
MRINDRTLRRLWAVLFVAVLFVAALFACGGVVGFCAGGLLGPVVFGDRGGHGLGNLGYLFEGAAGGAALGLVIGLVGLWAWKTVERQGKVLLGAMALTGVTALSTLLVVWLAGGW